MQTAITTSKSKSLICCDLCSADEIQQGSKALADVLEIDLPLLKKMKPKDAVPPAGPSPCDRCGRVVYG